MSRMRFAIEQALNAKPSNAPAEPTAEASDVNNEIPPPIVVSVEGLAEQIAPASVDVEAHEDAAQPTIESASEFLNETVDESSIENDPWEEVARANGYAADSSFNKDIDDIDSLMDRFDEDVASHSPSDQREIEIGAGFLQHIKDIDSADYPEPPTVEEIDEYPSPDLNAAQEENVSRFLLEGESEDYGAAAGFVDDAADEQPPADWITAYEDTEESTDDPVDPFSVQSVTTDQRSYSDSVKAAQEVAGWYQPEDISPNEPTEFENQDFQKPELDFEPPEAIYDPHSEFKIKDYNPDEEFGSGKTIAQTEFEASVVDSLGLPKVHTQYEQIWSAMRNGQMLKSPQIIGVVTTEPELHVAAVLSHLAIMISYEMGRHVLLVDGDARQRALTNAMELEEMRGFNETCTLECGWREAVIPTSHKKLCILPAGNLSINSTQIESLFLPTMANEWREMFDVVFVDIGDAQAPMARPLYKMCDKTFLLVRLGHTNRDFADEIADQLADDGVNLSGCIVTNLP